MTPYPGTWIQTIFLGLPNTQSSSSKNVNASNNEKASEYTLPKPNISYALDHIFVDPNSLPMENKHITPAITQTNFAPWIKTFWDPSPPTFEHDPNDTIEPYIYAFDQSLFNTDDGISLVYPELIDWDKQGSPTFDQF